MSIPPRRIEAKLRSMPTRKTPSAVYVQMHQLANEKERLQQEVRRLSDRQAQVIQRLQEIDQNLAKLESDAEDYALQAALPDVEVKVAQAIKRQASSGQKVKPKAGGTFDSMTIEY